MHRFYNDRSGAGDQEALDYDAFKGTIYVVDLASIDGQTEDFEGREWLEWRTKEKLPVGWDLEWVPDRWKGVDNPIALMQFADESTCLLVRTHRSGSWLPVSIMRCLMSDGCQKVGVGWDGPDKTKMQNTFNFQPVGIVDLAAMAKDKGLTEQGLKTLCERFGYKPKKDSKIARSNWACWELSPDQVRYAAEDAYFTYLLLEKLQSLPDFVPQDDVEGYAILNQGVLEIQKGWEEHGIVRKHDGLWCTMCDKGPMNVPMVVEQHMKGAKHQKKFEARQGLVKTASAGPGVSLQLPAEYLEQGIIAGDGFNGLRVGEFKCSICDAGPFNAMQVIEAHLNSKRHKKATEPPEPVPEPVAKRDPFVDMLWNMPDYVEVRDHEIHCTLCNSKANAILPMMAHLGGNAHAKKCRGASKDELLFIKDKGRMERMSDGQPVVRTGFRLPKADELAQAAAEAAISGTATAAAQTAAAAKAAARTAPIGELRAEAPTEATSCSTGPLEEGWKEHVDPNSGCSYYYNAKTKVSSWERPVRKATPAKPTKVDASDTLPPGWQAVWDDQCEKYYYADIETQESTWVAPQPYVARAWERHIDPLGRAYWTCAQLEVSFYEVDDKWQRLVDDTQRIYWSHPGKDIRFFEPEVGEGRG